ncbi:MAG: hypothetical protein WKG32_20980 [Gemmatimonadaceae bacterium]
MSDENLPIILGAIGLATVAVVGIVALTKKPAPRAPSSPTIPGFPIPIEPAGFFPGLKPGDPVLVDPVRAKIPLPGGVALPAIVGVVEMLLSDPTLVSIDAQVIGFRGTIPRSSIIRILSTADLVL